MPKNKECFSHSVVDVLMMAVNTVESGLGRTKKLVLPKSIDQK
jgi:hypothetical protein